MKYFKMRVVTLTVIFILVSSIEVDAKALDREERDDELDEEMQSDEGFFEVHVDHEKESMHIHVLVKAEFRNALSDPKRFWKDGVVPYKISRKYGAFQKDTILDAMEEFKHKTCIRFVPKRSDTAFIFIEPGSGCSATVGMVQQGKVTLSRGCNNRGIVIHEFMHILGFLHEHSRPDRDKYVKINWENIQEQSRRNFRKYTEDQVQNGNITYDYNSIMHYGAFSFAKNRSVPSITPLQENVTIGQRNGFSQFDLEKIHHLYNCKMKTTREASETARILSKSTTTITRDILRTTELINTNIIMNSSVIATSPFTVTIGSTAT